MQRNDQQLIADYLNGDDGAITILIDRHLKTVFNFTYRLIGKQEEAENIAQETFLKMWRNLKKYRQGENFKTWLFTIARNTAIDWLRKKKSIAFSNFENEKDENAFAESLTDPEPLPDEIFARAEEKTLLDNALKNSQYLSAKFCFSTTANTSPLMRLEKFWKNLSTPSKAATGEP